MMQNNIEYGDWVYLKNNPKIQIQVWILNPNGIIDFREQRSEPPYYAHIQDVVKITDKNQIDELENGIKKPRISRI